jgi:predicted ester cyclase
MNSQLTEQNKKLVLEHYHATVTRVDAGAIRRQVSPDFVDHESPRGASPGPEWVITHVASCHAAFPDIRVDIHEILAERDLVAVRATWSVTHSGVYLGHPPTHRRFELRGMVMWRVSGGLIRERWGCLDRLGLLQQLGLAPAAPPYDYAQLSGNREAR